LLILIKYYTRLHEPEIRLKYGSLYLGVKTDQRITTFCVIEFMLVRFLFALLTYCLILYPGILVNCYMLLNNFNIVYLGWFRPYDSHAQNNIELANTWMLHMVSYCLLLLVNLMPNPESEIHIGWMIIGMVGLIFAVNFGYMMSLNIKQVCRDLYLRKLRKERDARVKKKQENADLMLKIFGKDLIEK